ncbi:MAG: hypothetical protein U0414_38010 [Polyangiaceae bacterium]
MEMRPFTIQIRVEPSRWLRRGAFFGSVLAAMALTGAAFGAPPKVFSAGEVLKAADLNANFADLDTGLTAVEASVASLDTDLTALDTKVTGIDTKVTALDTKVTGIDTRVTALEAAPTFLTATGTTGVTGNLGADVTYQGMSLDLTPGTWRIDASVTVSTTIGQADGVQIALWNDTAMTELPNSRSAVGATGSVGGCPAGGCLAVPLVTSTVVTVAAATKLRVRALRNGASQVVVSPPAGLTSINRMTALKLR